VIDACARFKRGPTVYRESLFYLGGEADVRSYEQSGYLKAIDVNGREVWSWRGRTPWWLHAVHGGRLVFTASPTVLRRLRRPHRGAALALPDGERHPQQPGHYSVRGKQYIAVPHRVGRLGGGVRPGAVRGHAGELAVVFALP
jgi:hypothetical protein